MPVARESKYKSLSPIFLERWSPRAFSEEPIALEDIETLFEASRWAPSCYNDQPWLFLYAYKPEELEVFRSILAEGNQVWANRAPVLAYLFSRKDFSHNAKPNRWAQFDCGAAWMSLSLQARSMGLITHAMAGFDEEKAYSLLGVPRERYTAMAAIAMGKPGDPALLPEKIREREYPNARNPLKEIIMEGGFAKP